MLLRETLLLSFDLRGIIEGETGELSTIPVGVSIGALTLGATAFFASIISPISPEKVVVEPAFLQNLERDQKLKVFLKLHKSVYLVQSAEQKLTKRGYDTSLEATSTVSDAKRLKILLLGDVDVVPVA